MKLVTKCLLLAIMFTPVLLVAQPDNPGGGGAPVPIDGGISILIAAGAAIGAKKARDVHKKRQEEKEM